ncbi:hypothetical protein HKX48_009093 [Thoreauomyces humboldtii]|nr:hypothetical protein HKX48_009093 [Thoreauomyces humboldtii]
MPPLAADSAAFAEEEDVLPTPLRPFSWEAASDFVASPTFLDDTAPTVPEKTSPPTSRRRGSQRPTSSVPLPTLPQESHKDRFLAVRNGPGLSPPRRASMNEQLLSPTPPSAYAERRSSLTPLSLSYWEPPQPHPSNDKAHPSLSTPVRRDSLANTGALPELGSRPSSDEEGDFVRPPRPEAPVPQTPPATELTRRGTWIVEPVNPHRMTAQPSAYPTPEQGHPPRQDSQPYQYPPQPPQGPPTSSLPFAPQQSQHSQPPITSAPHFYAEPAHYQAPAPPFPGQSGPPFPVLEARSYQMVAPPRGASDPGHYHMFAAPPGDARYYGMSGPPPHGPPPHGPPPRGPPQRYPSTVHGSYTPQPLSHGPPPPQRYPNTVNGPPMRYAPGPPLYGPPGHPGPPPPQGAGFLPGSMHQGPAGYRPLPPNPEQAANRRSPSVGFAAAPAAEQTRGPSPHLSFAPQALPPSPRDSLSSEEGNVSTSMANLEVSDAPRPTFRKLTVKRAARDPTVKAEKPAIAAAAASAAHVTKMSHDKTIEMYRQNALKSGDLVLKFEFAKFCIEESVKAPDQKTKDKMMEEGFSLFKELAKAGNTDAMYTLGQAYLDDSQYSLAHSQLLGAAKRSHSGAMYLLGIMSEKGAGAKKNARVAMDFYAKSAQAGFKPALYRLGMIELFGQLSGKRDVRKGIMWLKRGAAVADREHPECLHQLALVFEDGIPPHAQQDEGYAKGLLIEAAEMDYAPSQYKLACCYEFERLGCEHDLTEAMFWYSRASENEDADAQFAFAGWYLQGQEGVIAADPYKAYAWTYRAAMKDHPKAQYAIGYFCEMGIGCERNPEKADRWYRLAAALGEDRAMTRLGITSAPAPTKEKGLFGFLKK